MRYGTAKLDCRELSKMPERRSALSLARSVYLAGVLGVCRPSIWYGRLARISLRPGT